jgi:hypothetical protein
LYIKNWKNININHFARNNLSNNISAKISLNYFISVKR